MHDEKPRGRRGLIVSVVLVGLIAGAAGVYATLWGAGNASASSCAPSYATVDRLRPMIHGEVAALIPADEPKDVSDLAFQRIDGTAMTLADFRGRSVLLNLWATWCAPCREEMPALDALQSARGGERFEVVTVNVDVGDPAKPAAFLEETGIKALPDYRDPRMKIFNDLKTRSLAFGMPTTLLIDEAGCHVAALHGPAEWDSVDALALVDALTGAP
jgi:thiol-disulfide isomerase/thioredoxin